MKKKRAILIISSFVALLVLCIVFNNKGTYANPIDENNRIINPEWIEYINLTEEEKEKYQVIPQQYIDDTQPEINDSEIISDLPNYYNLRDYNLVSDIKDQGMSGLCWLYTGMTVFESNLRRSFNDQQILSINQFDYARSNSIFEYDRNNFRTLSPYFTGRIGSGGNYSQYLQQIMYGISPINSNLETNFEKINNYYYTLKDLYNLDNIEYYAVNAIDFQKNNYEEGSEDYNKFMNLIKSYLIKYGALSLNSVYGEDYIYNDEYSNVKVFDTDSGHYPNHALTLIGWDDDYEYAYCKTERGTSSDLSNCDKIISGKGAWIVQNSGGEEHNPIIYYTYSSSNISFGAIKQIIKKDWDNNYDVNKLINKSTQYINDKSVFSFTYLSNINEKINRVSMLIPSHEDYKIYFVGENGDRHLLKSGYSRFAELISVDLSEKNDDYLHLNGETFSIEVEKKGASYPTVTCYSKIYNDKNDITAKTVIKDKKIYTYSSDFMIYTSTHNISSGEKLDYVVKDSSGIDVTNRFDFSSYYVLNNLEKVKVIIKEAVDGEYNLETYYNDELLDTTNFNLETIEGIGSGGVGSDSEPFIINSVEDLVEIQNRGGIYLTLSYALANDIDMYDYLLNNKWIPVGTSKEPFSGKLNGNGYSINNIYVTNDTYSGLFGFLDNATITNLKIWSAHVEGMQAGVLVANSINSSIKNVMISGILLYNQSNNDIVKSLGSCIGVSDNDSIENIASYVTIYGNDSFGYASNYVGGIIGKSFNSVLGGFLYKGDIMSGYISGGAIGHASSIDIYAGTIITSISSYKKSAGIIGYIDKDNGWDASSVKNIILNVNYNSESNRELYFTDNDNVVTQTIYYVNNDYDTGINIECYNNYYATCGYIYPLSKEEFNNQSNYSHFCYSGQYSWNCSNNYPIYYEIPVYDDYVNITSKKYNVDLENGYIYNIKAISSEKSYITVDQFLGNITTDENIHIYKYDKSKELTGEDHISSNDILEVKGKYYTLSIIGDCYNDGSVNIGDATIIKRIAAGYEISRRKNIFACDVSRVIDRSDNITSLDASILQRNLADLSSEIYEEE